jgi:hypothetical protein
MKELSRHDLVDLNDRYIKYKDEFDRKNNEIDREKIF